MLEIRLAAASDIDDIAAIYEKIHTEEEKGLTVIGWDRNIYPTRATAEAAVALGDMFAAFLDGKLVSSCRINKEQVPIYKEAAWEYEAADDEVMVLHTLTVDPDMGKMGIATSFVSFYESYALSMGCHFLRIDTNERNERARKLYRKLGYKEVSILPCEFNGIAGVNLVCLEKKI